MKLIFTYAVLAALVSCGSAPTVSLKPDGTKVVNLGFSLMEDSSAESARIVMADGTTIEYLKQGKNQSKVPLSGIRTYGTVGVTEILEKGLTARTVAPEVEATKRAGISAATEQAKINAAAATEQAKIGAEALKAAAPQ